jgi:2-polyprenyl-3-methyl-5-hydroxy-6-metoxy-1,4-benzoquinol methylase
MTTTPLPPLDQRLLDATTGALELFGVYLGDRLGLYAALRDGRSCTASNLAAACAIHPRYAREWLEQQAVAGLLAVDDPAAPENERRYALPAAHAGVLVDACDPSHLAPLARMIVGIAGTLGEVVAAYRSGAGVPFTHYGPDLRHGQGGINRPAFSTALVRDWVPAIPGAVARLETGGRVLDLGCGQGFAALAMARAFPRAEVWGVDADQPSIDDARAAARTEGLRVRFECADAGAIAAHGPFDLVLLLEVLHDLARPVDVLRSIRRAFADDGVLLVADELVAPAFTAPGNDLERMMYGWSISHCLPTQMTEPGSAAIGTVIRESTVRRLAADAGFSRVDVLDVDGGFFRLYAVRP